MSLLRNFTTYTSSGSVQVPENISQIWLRAQGAGGAGKVGTGSASGKFAGGGGGAMVELYKEITSSSWGNTVTFAIGAGVDGANGGDTSVSVTLEGVLYSLQANGGTRARQLGIGVTPGAGGTGSGGTTNQSGLNGSASIPPPDSEPGLAGDPGWGLYNEGGDPPPVPEGMGGAGSYPDGAGEDGSFQIEWIE